MTSAGRLTSTGYPADTAGNCQATTGAVTTSHSYDGSDRLQAAGSDAGVAYDAFGRVTTLPATDAGATGATATLGYYAGDLVPDTSQCRGAASPQLTARRSCLAPSSSKRCATNEEAELM